MSFKKSAFWLNLRGRLHNHYISLLTEELDGCRVVLDLGCGGDPYLGECIGVEKVIGVDACLESCRSAKRADKYEGVVQAVFPDLPFRSRIVDAVTMLQVVEHLPKDAATRLIERAEKLARRKIIITTPNGFVRQDGYDGNSFQTHLSGWTVEDFELRGYEVFGMEGPKIARRKGTAEMLPPKKMLSVLNSFGLFEEYLEARPMSAFQLMAVKELKRF
jgi:SAM-dependent methyltransferase